MSFRHWSRNVLLIAPDLLSIASYIRSLRILEGWASCTAILVTNTQASWTSSLPLGDMCRRRAEDAREKTATAGARKARLS